MPQQTHAGDCDAIAWRDPAGSDFQRPVSRSRPVQIERAAAAPERDFTRLPAVRLDPWSEMQRHRYQVTASPLDVVTNEQPVRGVIELDRSDRPRRMLEAVVAGMSADE